MSYPIINNQINSQFILDNDTRIIKKDMDYSEYKQRHGILQYDNTVLNKSKDLERIYSKQNYANEDSNLYENNRNSSGNSLVIASGNIRKNRMDRYFFKPEKLKEPEVKKFDDVMSKYFNNFYNDGSLQNKIFSKFTSTYYEDENIASKPKFKFKYENKKMEMDNRQINFDKYKNEKVSKLEKEIEKIKEDKEQREFEESQSKLIKNIKLDEPEDYMDPYLNAINKKRNFIKNNMKKEHDYPSSYVNNPQNKHSFLYKNIMNKKLDFNKYEEKRLVMDDSPNEFFSSKPSSCKDFYYQLNPNYEKVNCMEDYVKCLDQFQFKNHDGLFIMADGYEGYEISDYFVNRFPEIFSTNMTLFERDLLKGVNHSHSDTKSKTVEKKLLWTELNYNDTKSKNIVNSDNNMIYSNKEFEFGDIPNILIKSFKKIDFETQLCSNEYAGCSSTVVFLTVEKLEVLNPDRYIFKERSQDEIDKIINKDKSPSKKTFFKKSEDKKIEDRIEYPIDEKYIDKDKPKYIYQNQRIIYVSNVGDCRCVLVGIYSVKRLSYDHVVSDISESNRVKSCGGMIINNKTGGKTYLTRAIGDNAAKAFGLIASPYVLKHVMQGFERWLVIGSSGFWSVMKDDDLMRISMGMNTSEEFGRALMQLAKNRGVSMNCSVIAIALKSDYYF